MQDDFEDGGMGLPDDVSGGGELPDMDPGGEGDVEIDLDSALEPGPAERRRSRRDAQVWGRRQEERAEQARETGGQTRKGGREAGEEGQEGCETREEGGETGEKGREAEVGLQGRQEESGQGQKGPTSLTVVGHRRGLVLAGRRAAARCMTCWIEAAPSVRHVPHPLFRALAAPCLAASAALVQHTIALQGRPTLVTSLLNRPSERMGSSEGRP